MKNGLRISSQYLRTLPCHSRALSVHDDCERAHAAVFLTISTLRFLLSPYHNSFRPIVPSSLLLSRFHFPIRQRIEEDAAMSISAFSSTAVAPRSSDFLLTPAIKFPKTCLQTKQLQLQPPYHKPTLESLPIEVIALILKYLWLPTASIWLVPARRSLSQQSPAASYTSTSKNSA